MRIPAISLMNIFHLDGFGNLFMLGLKMIFEALMVFHDKRFGADDPRIGEIAGSVFKPLDSI